MYKLTAVDHLLIETIAAHPGLPPLKLHDFVKEKSLLQAGSMSAATSRLIRLKKVNRLRLPGTHSYIYYPKSAALPEGHTEWHNKLLRVVKGAKRAKKGLTKVHNGPNGVAAFVTEMEAPTPPTKPGSVLLVLEMGTNKSITLTIEEARQAYADLHALFNRTLR